MVPEEIAQILKNEFGPALAGAKLDGAHPRVLIEAAHWPAVARFLRDDRRMGFNLLRCISGIDRPAEGLIEVSYELVAMRPAARPDELWSCEQILSVCIRVPRDGGSVPSVARLWAAADWHEREAFDLFGVRFDGHPDHRRILLPDDWVGYPLRKDYEFPREYHGIPGSTEFEQNSPVH